MTDIIDRNDTVPCWACTDASCMLCDDVGLVPMGPSYFAWMEHGILRTGLVLDEAVVKWLGQQYAPHYHGGECHTDFRLAVEGDLASLEAYDSIRSRGCCGFADWEAVGPDGRRYYMGFNYGH